MPGAYTWEQLARLTLRRQFPAGGRAKSPSAVAELVARIGPIQSQVARSPFVAVAARRQGLRYADIVAAYEAYDIVRGSNLRGTVHTCSRRQHAPLDSVTRRSLATNWRRALRLERLQVADVQAAMERYATGEWRTPEQLRGHLVDWISSHEAPAAVAAASTPGVGRAMAHLHSAMIRRPLDGAAWERQGTPGYRVATDVLGEPRSPLVDDPDAALVELTRLHLASYGPANRRDIAWWSGSGLRHVDAALSALGGELTARPGPDGQTYYDLEAITARQHDPGVRLLPEFDATIVGYDPKTRDRFVDPAHLPHFWLASNGMFTSVVLKDARLVASWRFAGPEGKRRIEVRTFPGAVAVTDSELAGSIAAVEIALDLTVVDVDVAPVEG